MPQPLRAIDPYVSHLEKFTKSISVRRSWGVEDHNSIENALNGELSRTVCNLVSRQVLQEYGAFFTNEEMSCEVAKHISEDASRTAKVLDAACGGGNLLLAHARRMPLRSTWDTTLRFWGRKLHGLDVHEPFVRASRVRLALLAAQRGVEHFGVKFVKCQLPPLEELFPQIKSANSLNTPWPATEYVLLNPPFNIIPVPHDCTWTTGRVSSAPLFINRCIEQSQSGTVIRAILPDVLRSGTRYRKWRQHIQSQSSMLPVKTLGTFDSDTAVDVFLLTLETGKSTTTSEQNLWLHEARDLGPETELPTLNMLFYINVGRVVPHRDHDDPALASYPYFDVQNTPAWESVQDTSSRRHFGGNTFEPPFVLIRRNSRSKDRHRAVGTLVEKLPNTERAAVENHLIVAKPISGSLKDCKKLIEVLRNNSTSEWLNKRIRCRHLTIEAVGAIPWRC